MLDLRQAGREPGEEAREYPPLNGDAGPPASGMQTRQRSTGIFRCEASFTESHGACGAPANARSGKSSADALSDQPRKSRGALPPEVCIHPATARPTVLPGRDRKSVV